MKGGRKGVERQFWLRQGVAWKGLATRVQHAIVRLTQRNGQGFEPTAVSNR